MITYIFILEMLFKLRLNDVDDEVVCFSLNESNDKLLNSFWNKLDSISGYNYNNVIFKDQDKDKIKLNYVEIWINLI